MHLQSKELEGDHGHHTGDTHADGRSAGSHRDDGGGSGAAGTGAAARDGSTGGLGDTRGNLFAGLLLSGLVAAGLVAAGGFTLATVGLRLRSESSRTSVG
jgi:hypothetical protein